MASRRVGDAVTRRIPPGFYFGVEHLLSEQRQFYLKVLWRPDSFRTLCFLTEHSRKTRLT